MWNNGDRGSTVVKVLRYKSEGRWFDGVFHWHKSFWSHYGLGVDSASNKWVPGVFPGAKCGRCVRLTTLPPSSAVVTKSGNLNFLEPSGTPQACNGTALPLMSLILNNESSRSDSITPVLYSRDPRFKTSTRRPLTTCFVAFLGPYAWIPA
jgi:hypothetical protein